MTRHLRLTDADVRAALAPAPELPAPSGLLAAISADVARTPQHRRRVRLPEVPAKTVAAWLPYEPRLAWVALAVALLLAAMAGSLIAGVMLRGRPEQPLADLVPTGIEIMVPDTGAYDRVVVDGNGTTWALGPGRLARFDQTTGERRTWTIADDQAFATPTFAASRAGGVWLVSGPRVVRFTGEGFADAIPVRDNDVFDVIEAPDGTLWTLGFEDGPLRWDSQAWQAPVAGRPAVATDLIAITNGGDVWVSNSDATDPQVGQGVSRLAGERWTTWSGLDAKPLSGGIAAIEEAADGSTWVANLWIGVTRDPGLARFDGVAWTVIDGPGFQAAWLEAAPDGSMWATSPGGGPLVARYRDGAWTRWDRGLAPTGTDVGRVSETPSGTFLATDAGLRRLVGDRWEPVWPDAVDGPARASVNGLVAVSADEAWVADPHGAWHYLDGRWEGPTEPESFRDKWIHDLEVGPDGSVWLAGQAGVAVLRDGAWTLALEGEARNVVLAPDGTAWVGRQSPGIIGLRRSGTGYTTESVPCPAGAMSMVATPDGTIWLGSHAYAGFPGLARYDGSTCTMVDVLGAGGMQEVTGLVTGPDGDVAVEVLLDWSEDQTVQMGGSWTRIVARLQDGRWRQIERREHVYGAWGTSAIDPRGALWQTSPDVGDLERFDGRRWVPSVRGVDVFGPMMFAPDGSLWSVGPSGVQRISASRLAAD